MESSSSSSLWTRRHTSSSFFAPAVETTTTTGVSRTRALSSLSSPSSALTTDTDMDDHENFPNRNISKISIGCRRPRSKNDSDDKTFIGGCCWNASRKRNRSRNNHSYHGNFDDKRKRNNDYSKSASSLSSRVLSPLLLSTKASCFKTTTPSSSSTCCIRASSTPASRIRIVSSLLCCLFLFLAKTTVLNPPPSFVDALSITTFNILASVHRSMKLPDTTENRRESEQKDWWQPRAKGLAKFVANELSSSDVVLLQEWWFNHEFEQIFDHYTGDIFDRVAARRPGGSPGSVREDGMAVLVKKKGALELCMDNDNTSYSKIVQTGPQRIAQIVTCRERRCNDDRPSRYVLLGNAHLSFPGNPDAIVNERRQAYEVLLLARAMSRMGRRLSQKTKKKSIHGDNKNREGHMHIIGGDFNSNILSKASTTLLKPPHYFVNCMSAYGETNLGSIGGKVNIGITHCTHRGDLWSVDQLFCRLIRSDGNVCKTSLGRLGGPTGTYVVNCQKQYLQIKGSDILSDHMPVTATLYWPTKQERQTNGRFTRRRTTDYYLIDPADSNTNTTIPLHPLQSPWDS